jgi:hypothetical protein
LKTNNLKQTGTPHANQHSLREQLDANAHRTQHTIMLSLADSHSSLSQKKDKNTDRSLAHLAVLHSVFHSQKSKQKPNRNRKTRKSNIISAAGSTGFPTQQQQRQSIQFHSTKLNQFSQSFNAQLSPARNSHTHNPQSRLNRARGNKAAQSSQ